MAFGLPENAVKCGVVNALRLCVWVLCFGLGFRLRPVAINSQIGQQRWTGGRCGVLGGCSVRI